MSTSMMLAVAGALTAASLEVLVPGHRYLPTAIDRWGAEPVLLAAAMEGALVFLLFGRWLPTEAPWRDLPRDPDPDVEGAHHVARRIAISAPLLIVYAGQRLLMDTERIGLVLAGSLAEATGAVVCDGAGGCLDAIVSLSLTGVHLLFAVCLMGPVWWMEAEAASSWDRHHPHHRPRAGF